MFHEMNMGENIFRFGWKAIFYEFLKTWNPIFLQSTRAADHMIIMLRFVT